MNDMNCEKCWRSSVLLLKYIIFFRFALLRRAWTISPLSYWKKTLARQAASATIQYTIIVVIVQLCTTDDRQSRLGVHWWSSCLRHGLIPLELAPHGAIQGAVVEVIWAWHRAYNGHLEGIHGHTVLPVRTHPNIIWLYTYTYIYIYISNSIQFRSDLWNRLKWLIFSWSLVDL